MRLRTSKVEEIFPGDLIVEMDEQAMIEISLLIVSVSKDREVTFLLLGEDQLQEAIAVRRQYEILSRVTHPRP